MKKHFNIAGPCSPNLHYMQPALERCQGLFQLIDQAQYFVIHAARQSGKTTLLLDLTKQLNEAGNYYALYCSLESVQALTEAEQGIPAIIHVLKTQVMFHTNLRKYPFADKIDYADFTVALRQSLTFFCERLDKPLVVLFDEVDCLSNGTLISFLRQLRDGYINRLNNTPFVHSIGLVGMRNIRDYKGKIRDDSETLGSASPFNIVTESLTLRNFTIKEITNLYIQHTEQTKQVFSPEVIEKIYHYSQGQPWLVNALAKEIVVKILDNDFSKTINLEYVEQAAQSLITQRNTHIDSLMERLKESRVQRIVEPVLLGEAKGYDLLDDDYQYVLDLGLLKEDNEKGLIPSNPIYSEVLIRVLTASSQMEMKKLHFPSKADFVKGNKISLEQILKEFQVFWRENSEIWVERYQYKEAAPHLILQAYLQQVVITGGRISREMAGGRGRLDLCLHYGEAKYPIELKLRYSDKTYKEGLLQLAEYMDVLDCKEGWLIVFEQRKKLSWKKKIFWKTKHVEGKTIHIVGC